MHFKNASIACKVFPFVNWSQESNQFRITLLHSRGTHPYILAWETALQCIYSIHSTKKKNKVVNRVLVGRHLEAIPCLRKVYKGCALQKCVDCMQSLSIRQLEPRVQSVSHNTTTFKRYPPLHFSMRNSTTVYILNPLYKEKIKLLYTCIMNTTKSTKTITKQKWRMRDCHASINDWIINWSLNERLNLDVCLFCICHA